MASTADGRNGRSLRLGTRGSQLALTQSRRVAEALEATGRRVVLEVVRTRGDVTLDRPLPEIGGKGLFTAELDRALLDGSIDLAVHSLKDLPTAQPDGLVVATVPEREDPRDAVVLPGGAAGSLAGLPEGAVVGTSSLRRRALLAAFRPDVRVRDVRGNLDTRLEKLDGGGYDALILAAAGLRRMGFGERIAESLERTSWLPAPGQGALGVVARTDDDAVLEPLASLGDPAATAAVTAERALLARLEGGCQVPIGALGMAYRDVLRLWGLVASDDGGRMVRADLTARPGEAPEALGRRLAEVLLERGAAEILDVGAPSPEPGAR